MGQHFSLEPHFCVVKHFLSEDLAACLAVGVRHVVGVVHKIICVVRLQPHIVELVLWLLLFLAIVLVHKLVRTRSVLQLQLRGFHVCYAGLVLQSLLLHLQLLNLRLLTLELLSSFPVQSLGFLQPANQLEHFLLLLGFALAGLVQLQLHLLHCCELAFALCQQVLHIVELQSEVLLRVLFGFQELFFELEFVGDLGELLLERVGFGL